MRLFLRIVFITFLLDWRYGFPVLHTGFGVEWWMIVFVGIAITIFTVFTTLPMFLGLFLLGGLALYGHGKISHETPWSIWQMGVFVVEHGWSIAMTIFIVILCADAAKILLWVFRRWNSLRQKRKISKKMGEKTTLDPDELQILEEIRKEVVAIRSLE